MGFYFAFSAGVVPKKIRQLLDIYDSIHRGIAWFLFNGIST